MCHNVRKVTSNGTVTFASWSAHLEEHDLMLHLTGTSELREKKNPNVWILFRFVQVWVATYAQPCRPVSVVEGLVNGRCAAGLAWHKPANATAPTTKIPVAPALLVGLSSAHVVVSLEILTIPSIRNNRWSHSQGNRLPTYSPFFKPEFSHWHRSCSLFHVSKSEFSGWPGRQKWLTPRCRTLGSKPEACRSSWPCDLRGKDQRSVWLREKFVFRVA